MPLEPKSLQRTTLVVPIKSAISCLNTGAILIFKFVFPHYSPSLFLIFPVEIGNVACGAYIVFKGKRHYERKRHDNSCKDRS